MADVTTFDIAMGVKIPVKIRTSHQAIGDYISGEINRLMTIIRAVCATGAEKERLIQPVHTDKVRPSQVDLLNVNLTVGIPDRTVYPIVVASFAARAKDEHNFSYMSFYDQDWVETKVLPSPSSKPAGT